MEIDTFHERASAPAPRISRFFHPNDESWGGVVKVGVDSNPFLLVSLHAR